MIIRSHMEGSTKLELKQALLIYSGDNKQAVTIHNVQETPSGVVLSPGALVSSNGIRDALEGYEIDSLGDIMPENTLISNSEKLVWVSVRYPCCSAF
jgi:hypothetical protein